jgi:hypothetical protein
MDPPKDDSWLRMTEAMFGLLHCKEMQKMLFTTQKLDRSACAWWATFTATLPACYQVLRAEFHEALWGHHILGDLMGHNSRIS